uniref:BPTI/Kunitz inhibitor domain-containing protein n=1 Tax=Romanomermis culicivorax TaxID=13658 RepID=A0A915L2I6_ROMCU
MICGLMHTLDHKNVCKQPIQSGECKAYFPRYGYNTKTKRCQPSVFGGCDKNQNNFYTKGGCERVCVHEK